MVMLSMQIILRMRRNMSGAELEAAIASVLANLMLATEQVRRRQWQQRVESAAEFKPE
jgi:hypothetical protein